MRKYKATKKVKSCKRSINYALKFINIFDPFIKIVLATVWKAGYNFARKEMKNDSRTRKRIPHS